MTTSAPATSRSARRCSTVALLGVAAVCGTLAHLGARGWWNHAPASTAAAAPVAPVTTLSGPRSDAPATILAGDAAARSGAATGELAPWVTRWSSLLAEPSAPQRDRALAALLEELARTDPQGALAHVDRETNWRLREQLRDAALRGWAATKPDAAADWALQLRPEDRRNAMGAVLAGAAENPAEAVRVALRACAADPEPAGDYGHAAIAGLVEHGAYVEAVQFGQSVGTDQFPFLLRSAFYQWAQRDPADALAALETVDDPALRLQARAEVFNGWARADSRALAQYALTLTDPTDRATALGEALPHWVEKDPEGATDWIQGHDSGPEFDDGAAALAGTQSLIRGQPSLAMSLATNLHDRTKRAHTMRLVFRQWAERDRGAAQHYLASSAGADRALLTAELKDLFPDG